MADVYRKAETMSKQLSCIYLCPRLLAGCSLLGVWAAAQAATPLESLSLSPDVTALVKQVSVNDEDVVLDDFGPLGNLVDLGTLPAAADVDAFHPLPDGAVLFSVDTTVALPGLSPRPSDIIRFSTGSYVVEFSGYAAGIPAGVNVDALTLSNGDLIVSFDVATELGGKLYQDEDLVRYDGVSFSMFLQGVTAGIEARLDVDGVHQLDNGSLLLSLDVAGTVDGISFEGADVLEYDPVFATWTLVYDATTVPLVAGVGADALAATQPPDKDGDGIQDSLDNCILVPNPTQCDGDLDGYGNHCDADFNNDFIVNGLDIGPFKAGFGTADPVTDLNCDGITNGLDVGFLKTMFGFPPGPSGIAP